MGLNTLLDAVLYGANFGTSMIPVLSFFGKNIPDSAATPMAVCLSVIPVVTTLTVFLCQQKYKNVLKHEDPTMKLSEDDLQDEEFRQEQLMRMKSQLDNMDPQHKGMLNIPTSTKDPMSLCTRPIVQTSGYQNINQVSAQPVTLESEQEDSEEDNIVDLGGVDNFGVQLDLPLTADDCIIEQGMLDSIEQCRNAEKGISPLYNNGIPFIAKREKLSSRVESMYEMIDIVLDGSTMEQLTNLLNIMMMLGGAAFGWYIGMLMNPARTMSHNYSLVC